MAVTNNPDGRSFARYELSDKSVVRQQPLSAGQKLEVIRLVAEAFEKVSAPGMSFEKIEPSALIGMLTGDLLPNFLGVILLKNDEKPQDLAHVQDFVGRGKEFLFLMEDEQETEAFVDFFYLNKQAIEKVIGHFGLTIDGLTKVFSEMLSSALPESQSSSPTDGGKTPA
jgi:hypothetical protein